MTTDELLGRKQETVDEYYGRSREAAEQLANGADGVVLIVAHAPSIDACVRPLLGHTSTRVTRADMDKTGCRYPYAAVVALEQVRPPYIHLEIGKNRFAEEEQV